MKTEKTKLRFIEVYERKDYFEGELKSIIALLKVRLNMVESKCNFKGRYGNNLGCELCGLEDTTEHIFECVKLNEIRNRYSKGTLNIKEPNVNLAEYVIETIEYRKQNGFLIEFGENECGG